MKKKRVSIEVYDADGVLRESIGGPMDFEDIHATMTSVLKNDGIPVLKSHGKHEMKVQPPTPDAVPPLPKFEPLLHLHWEFDGIKFDATGKYEDVMDAQAEFLQGI